MEILLNFKFKNCLKFNVLEKKREKRRKMKTYDHSFFFQILSAAASVHLTRCKNIKFDKINY